MSLALLETLDERRAFEATHRYSDLGLFHVPFDELTGTKTTEAALKAIAEQGGTVALAGRSGAGKSSVIASVLGPLIEGLAEDLVPLRIPVAAEDSSTATDPGAFTRHLLRTVIRYSSELLSDQERHALSRSTASQVTSETPSRTHRASLGAPKLVADVGFASEVKSGAEQFVNESSAGDAVDGLARLVEVFRAHGREPFLIVDDSDRWVRIGNHDFRSVADDFFMKVVPMLARESGCGFVIAVHDEYLAMPSYLGAQQLLSRVISLPLPGDANAAIQAILNRRIELAGVVSSAEALIDAEALATLAERYQDDRSLRRMLATVDRATQRGCADGVDSLGPDLVQTALADLR